MGFTLIIDNYDSFTWNVYADVATLGGNPLVRRNDKITIEEIEVGHSRALGHSGGRPGSDAQRQLAICGAQSCS
jgi:anthranilate/para-aminobenzoate synthase component II